jgi:hypothetical protein
MSWSVGGRDDGCSVIEHTCRAVDGECEVRRCMHAPIPWKGYGQLAQQTRGGFRHSNSHSRERVWTVKLWGPPTGTPTFE